jgi:sphingosine kinase
MPLLVLLNPAAGAGASEQLFQAEVAPLLAAAGVLTQVQPTERAGHATAMVAKLDLSSISGIVVVSGDGLVSEVVNALMGRTDWTQAIRTPIGCAHYPHPLPRRTKTADLSSYRYSTIAADW